jgi:hypothetical protein
MAVAGATDFSQIPGDFKVRYARKYKEVRGKANILSDLFKFEKQNLLGANFQVPVVLSYQGGENFTPAGDTNNYRPPISAKIPYAIADNNEIVHILRLPFGVIAKASNGDDVSFATPEVLKMLTLNKSMARSQEISFLHGLSSVGQAASVAYATPAAGFVTVTMTAATWAPGLFSGVDGHPYQAVSALPGNSGTLRNDASGNNDYIFVSRNLTTKALVFQGIGAAGTASATATSVQTSDYLFRSTAVGSTAAAGSAGNITGTECAGIKFILSQSALGGTLFNIPTTNTLWSAVQVAIGGTVLSTAALYRTIAALRDNGLEDDVFVITSTRSWSNVLAELQTQRDFDVSYSISKLQSGTLALELAADGIKINLVSHPYLMWGDTFVSPKSAFMRIGSSEPTMELDGVELAVMSASNSSIEFRMFSAQALLPVALAQTAYLSGIVPT